MNYQQIGKTLETTGKDIQRLNNKLDKVLEKLLDVEALEKHKAEAVAQIQAGEITAAINTLRTVEKGLAKAESLHAEEAALREELKAHITTAERAVQGQVPAGQAEAPETATVAAIGRKVA